MLGFPLGILSAAGAGGVAGTYELIQTQILASSQASVVFSNLAALSSTYRHLQLRAVHKNSRPNLWSGSLLRFNSDTGNNYAYHYLVGNGSTVSSLSEFSVSSIPDPWVAGNTLGNAYSAAVYDILDAYSTTKNKTVRLSSARVVGGGEDRVSLLSGLYNNTAAISSISLVPTNSFDWVAGSRFSLYGIRG